MAGADAVAPVQTPDPRSAIQPQLIVLLIVLVGLLLRNARGAGPASSAAENRALAGIRFPLMMAGISAGRTIPTAASRVEGPIGYRPQGRRSEPNQAGDRPVLRLLSPSLFGLRGHSEIFL